MIVIDQDELLEIIDKTNQILTLLNNLMSLFGRANASPDSPSINGKLNKLIQGQADAAVFLGGMNDELITINNNVLALGSPQQTGSPVTLPSFGDTDVGAAVWAFDGASFPFSADLVVNLGGVWGQMVSQLSHDGYWGGYFSPIMVRYGETTDFTYVAPVLDLLDLVPGEDLLVTLTRQNPSVTVSWFDVEGGHVQLVSPTYKEIQGWVTTIDQAGFDRITFYMYTPSSGPPARSTLGDTNQLLSLIPLQYG